MVGELYELFIHEALVEEFFPCRSDSLVFLPFWSQIKSLNQLGSDHIPQVVCDILSLCFFILYTSSKVSE